MPSTKTCIKSQNDGLEKQPIMINENELQKIKDRYDYSDDIRNIVKTENLLAHTLLNRLHSCYPEHSSFKTTKSFLFRSQASYSGLSGFREICDILKNNGIELKQVEECELFIKVYRFLATRHSLNAIDWDNYESDSLFQLIMPQPGMIDGEMTKAYLASNTEKEKQYIIDGYMKNTNPHDGKQLLNKPLFTNFDGQPELLEGSQHKYPQCQLVFDKTTQNCFSFCTYCFRHAQVRGDEDMFLQDHPEQIHNYLKCHPEITDMLITGGDAGFMPPERFEQYIRPLIEDPELQHIRTVRLGSRMLTFMPEMILEKRYEKMLSLFDLLYDNGIQLAWMAHFSNPREILNPSTIAAIRRLKAHGVMIRSQSPIMNHISLFKDSDGNVDIEKSANNWIDLANILAMLGIGFHSMYCARPTGEHHYFSAPLADIEKVFARIYRSLSSINRPSRHISMTISAGKLAIIGTAFVNGEKCFALKFTESRNMEWMDRVFLAKYDEKTDKIDIIKPFDSENFFFEKELEEIETELAKSIHKQLDGCQV